MLKADSLSYILLIAYQSLPARVFIKQLISFIKPYQTLICLEIGKDKSRRPKFIDDPYFEKQHQDFLKKKAIFVSPQELILSYKEKLIDIAINFFLPFDFSSQNKVVDYHIIETANISQSLKKINIKRMLILSSIYINSSGYLPEIEDMQISEKPTIFETKQLLNAHLAEYFSNDLQIWRWSIEYMEHTYQHTCSSLEIVRVPSLGPTVTNYQGYSLKFNYFTYMIYQIGTGIISNLNASNSVKIDIIPADFAANFLMVLMLYPSNHNQLYNLSTTTRNPINLQQFLSHTTDAWKDYSDKPISLKVTEKKWKRKVNSLKESLPNKVQARLGVLMEIKSWKIEAQKASIEIQQRKKILQKYQYFFDKEWICESNKSIDLFNNLSSEDQVKFNFNVNSINWKTYVKLCVYSIKKYLLNDQVEEFKAQSMNLLQKKSGSYFSDIMWAISEGKSVKSRRLEENIQHVLKSKSVQIAIQALVEQKMLKLDNSPTAYEKIEEEYKKIALEMCQQMFSQYSMRSIRLFAWFLHKVFGTIYEKVVVDKQSLAKLQNHNQKEQGPIIIIPTHRSYIDFLIMSYVFFGYNLQCPHIAAAEDFLNMAVVHILLRKSGAFFIKRNQKKYRELYKAIMTQYISKLLCDSHYLQFFIEGTRSRVGKMLAPKYGILSIVVNNVLEGKVPDTHILPVTINYEKVLEGNSFTYEMMGQAKVKESLSRLIKAADVLKENYGRIYIEMCEPISIKKYFQNKNKESALNSLGEKIVHDLSDNLVVTSPAILSSVLLMNRKGISDDSLSQKMGWLVKQISSRGIKIARNQSDSSISINTTLALMENVLTKSKKDMFQVQVSFDQNSFVKLFTLTYYRNTLTHIFFQEAIIITALSSFGHQSMTIPRIGREKLFEQVKFLNMLLKNQFYLRHDLGEQKRFLELLDFLCKKGLLKVQNDQVVALMSDSNNFAFYWSLIWPIVQSYWISCLYLFKLIKSNSQMPFAKFLAQIQWFAQSLINERIVGYVEAISSDTIKNAISIFTSLKIVKNINQQYNGQQTTWVKIIAQEQTIRELKDKIQIFLKSSYGKSVKGLLESEQGSVSLDFPFLSKL